MVLQGGCMRTHVASRAQEQEVPQGQSRSQHSSDDQQLHSHRCGTMGGAGTPGAVDVQMWRTSIPTTDTTREEAMMCARGVAGRNAQLTILWNGWVTDDVIIISALRCTFQ